METQPRMWTPLVMESTGISLSGSPGQPSASMCAVTRRCRRLTALRRGACRNARAATLKGSAWFAGWTLPLPMNSFHSSPRSFTMVVKYFCMSSSGKRSNPAGTGVCVVNTVLAWTTCLASQYVRL